MEVFQPDDSCSCRATCYTTALGSNQTESGVAAGNTWVHKNPDNCSYIKPKSKANHGEARSRPCHSSILLIDHNSMNITNALGSKTASRTMSMLEGLITRRWSELPHEFHELEFLGVDVSVRSSHSIFAPLTVTGINATTESTP